MCCIIISVASNVHKLVRKAEYNIVPSSHCFKPTIASNPYRLFDAQVIIFCFEAMVLTPGARD